MPIQYKEGIIAEHKAVRTAAGIFDVSHMGRIIVSGEDAIPFMNHLTVNDVQALEPNQAQYSAMCRENGGTIDDILVYRFDSGKLLVVVNASNHGIDLKWMREHQEGYDVDIKDVTDETSLLAIQGPRAQEILSSLTDQNFDLDGIGYYHFGLERVSGVDAIISRTGYTGEDGFELMIPSSAAEQLWYDILSAGQEADVKPCGLGARDTLRLEVGYPLYGHELNETITPLEANLGRFIKLNKGNFIGRDALSQKIEGLKRRLVSVQLDSANSGIPRQGFTISKDDQDVGQLVSGTFSPSLKTGIGTGFVPPELAAKVGTEVEVDIRGDKAPGRIVRPPFYKQGSIRRK